MVVEEGAWVMEVPLHSALQSMENVNEVIAKSDYLNVKVAGAAVEVPMEIH